METLSSTKNESWLTWFLRGLLILGFLALFGRLFDLQIIRGGYFRSLAEGNRIRRVPIVAPRGQILARGGEVLVGNRMVKKRVVFQPDNGFIKDEDLGDAREDEIITEPVRHYLLAEEFAHISGYLGEIDSRELGKIAAECPEKGARRLGALTGRSGLEQKYDCVLAGSEGEELVEVDALGIKVRTLGRKEPLPGEDLKTHIDYGLQKKVAETMNGRKGAFLATDAQGEVLALYSAPAYDPNVFVDRKRASEISGFLESEDLPLFNRNLGGIYHPGSVFKPVVALAALEEGEIDENFTYLDEGHITIESPFGTFTYTNWYYTQYGGVEGTIDLPRAIARSTDTFFYKAGELVGVERIVDWAREIGLDKKTGIDLPGEITGLVPDPEWKLRTKGERWFLGNTYHLSIGQGDLALTPLAVNRAIAAIVTGKLCKPTIAGLVDCEELELEEKTTQLIKKGMIGACRTGGTGFTFFEFEEKSGIKVGCKTGTAETESGEPHAWFVAYAPADNPEIIATVMIENGGEGSRVAGPIAREIFDYWFVEKNN